jgi:hypothetical protein
MDIRNFNLRRIQVIKIGNTRLNAGFSFALSLHQNNRLENISLFYLPSSSQ